MKPLKYRRLAQDALPTGDIVFLDKRGRIAEPFNDDDLVQRIEFELATGRFAHIGDRAKRVVPFVVKQVAGVYFVMVTETDKATFATVREALKFGVSRNGPFRLLSDTQ